MKYKIQLVCPERVATPLNTITVSEEVCSKWKGLFEVHYVGVVSFFALIPMVPVTGDLLLMFLKETSTQSFSIQKTP